MIEDNATEPVLRWHTRIAAGLLSTVSFVPAVFLASWALDAPVDPASFGVFSGVLAFGLGFVGVNLFHAALTGDRDGFSAIRDGVQEYYDLLKRGSARAAASDDEDGVARISPEARS